jgi:hypothetical protein
VAADVEGVDDLRLKGSGRQRRRDVTCREREMAGTAIVGLELAKNVVQDHGVRTTGAVVSRKQLRRAQVLSVFEALPACRVEIEACASAHYWARELMALGSRGAIYAASVRVKA